MAQYAQRVWRSYTDLYLSGSVQTAFNETVSTIKALSEPLASAHYCHEPRLIPNQAAFNSVYWSLMMSRTSLGSFVAAARAMGLEAFAINDTNEFEKAFTVFKPTIILLDVSMPDRDGVELIGHLSKDNYRGKVAIMSGTDPRYIQMSSAIAKTRGLNVAGTLAKPFRMHSVTALLK